MNFSAFLGHPNEAHHLPARRTQSSRQKSKKKSLRKTQRDNERAAKFQERKRQENAAATAAANAQAAAETALDTFDDRFLGSKSSDPSVDNDGNALVDGALYFDTKLLINLLNRLV